MRLLGQLRRDYPSAKRIAVVCEFSEEDGVWNGVALDLPVAAFGDTFEEAKKNLGEAIISHLEALTEIGSIDAVIAQLEQQKQVPLELNRPMMLLEATKQDHKFALASCR